MNKKDIELNTAEKLYSIWHKYTVFYKTGKYPKSIKNWDRIHKKEKWSKFKSTAHKICRAGNLVDLDFYMKCLFEHFDGYVPMKYIGSPMSFKLHRASVKEKNAVTNIKDVKKSIVESLKYVKSYCNKHDLTYEEYIHEHTDTMPTLLKHYYKGSVCKFFISILPDDIYNIYSQDLIKEFIDFNTSRIKFTYLRNPKIEKISKNIKEYLNK